MSWVQKVPNDMHGSHSDIRTPPIHCDEDLKPKYYSYEEFWAIRNQNIQKDNAAQMRVLELPGRIKK